MPMAVKTSNSVDFTSVRFADVAKPIVERYAMLCLSQIKAAWPVDTGASRAAWGVSHEVQGHTAKISLTNSTSYAQYVEHKKGSMNGQELADSIVGKNTVLMNLEIEAALVAAFNTAKR